MKKYKPKGFQSVDEATATVDWLLAHSLRHVIWNWLKSRYYCHQGKYDFSKALDLISELERLEQIIKIRALRKAERKRLEYLRKKLKVTRVKIGKHLN